MSELTSQSNIEKESSDSIMPDRPNEPKAIISDEVAEHIFNKIDTNDFDADDIIAVTAWLKHKALQSKIETVESGLARMKKDAYLLALLLDLAVTTENEYFLIKADTLLKEPDFTDPRYDLYRDAVSKMRLDIMLGKKLIDTNHYLFPYAEEKTYHPRPLPPPAGYDRKSAGDTGPTRKKLKKSETSNAENTIEPAVNQSQEEQAGENLPAVILHIRTLMQEYSDQNYEEAMKLAKDATNQVLRDEAIDEIDAALARLAKDYAVRDVQGLEMARKLVKMITRSTTRDNARWTIGL